VGHCTCMLVVKGGGEGWAIAPACWHGRLPSPWATSRSSVACALPSASCSRATSPWVFMVMLCVAFMCVPEGGASVGAIVALCGCLCTCVCVFCGRAKVVFRGHRCVLCEWVAGAHCRPCGRTSSLACWATWCLGTRGGCSMYVRGRDGTVCVCVGGGGGRVG
jgi:hypothetical protein